MAPAIGPECWGGSPRIVAAASLYPADWPFPRGSAAPTVPPSRLPLEVFNTALSSATLEESGAAPFLRPLGGCIRCDDS